MIFNNFANKRESWTFYRFFGLIFSFQGLKRIVFYIWKVVVHVTYKIFGGPDFRGREYAKWCRKYAAGKKDLIKYELRCREMEYRPLILLILDARNCTADELNRSLKSIRSQIYGNFHLATVTQIGLETSLPEILKSRPDSWNTRQISVSDEAGYSSELNQLVKDSGAQFLTFCEGGSELTSDALFHFVEFSAANSDAEIVYSDEDRMDENGRLHTPFFKPEYAPDSLLSRNYFGHLVFVNALIFEKSGGLRAEFAHAMEYDLWLRISEMKVVIKRLPKLLYHRMTKLLAEAKNTAVLESSVSAIEQALERRRTPGKVVPVSGAEMGFRISYKLHSENALVSIIIPTKDKAEILSVCLESIFRKSNYQHFEVIVVNNNSTEKSLFDLLDHWMKAEPDRFKVLDQTYSFNFAKLMNAAVSFSKGEFIVLLNNDTEIISSDWLEQLMMYAQLPHTGAVGTKLLYPNNTIQHAGVIVGLHGIAGHSFVTIDRDDPGYLDYLLLVTNYSAVTAAALMISRSKYLEVGGFEEVLAVDLNDIDFCLKLLKRGYFNVFLPQVEIYHYESLTRGHPHANRENHTRQKSEWDYFRKNWQRFIDDDPFYSPNLSRINPQFIPRH